MVHRRGRRVRGFTLVELMAVVVITGILAIIGVSAMSRYVFSSKATEASATIQAIRSAQERWRADTLGYLSVSSTMTSWYPNAKAGAPPIGTPPDKFAWSNPGGNDYKGWRRLNPQVPGPVQYGYVTQAGVAGAMPPAFSTAAQPVWATPVEPWYVIEAACDANADGTVARMAASSLNGEILSEYPGE